MKNLMSARARARSERASLSPSDLIRSRSSSRSRARSRSLQPTRSSIARRRKFSRTQAGKKRGRQSVSTSNKQASPLQPLKDNRKNLVAEAVRQAKQRNVRQSSSTAIAPQLQSIKRHKNFKQLAAYSIDCITKVIDPIHSNWVWNLVECIEKQLATAVITVLTLHPDDEHVLLTVFRCLSLLAPYSNLAHAMVASGGFETALRSMRDNDVPQQECVDVLNVLVVISDDAPADIRYSAGSITVTEELLAMHTATANIPAKRACLKLLLNMSRVQECVQTLVQSKERLAQVTSLLEDDDADVVDATLQLLNNLGRRRIQKEFEDDSGGVKKVIAALKSHMDNENLLRSGAELLTTLIGEDDLELAIKRLQANGVSDAEIWFAQSLTSSNIEGLLERGVLSDVAHNLKHAREATDLGHSFLTLQLSSRTIFQIVAVEPHVIDAVHECRLAGEFLETYAELSAALLSQSAEGMGKDKQDKLHDNALADVVNLVKKLIVSVPPEAFTAKIFATLSSQPDLRQHAVAVCELVGASQLESSIHAISGVLAVLSAHRSDADVQVACMEALLVISRSQGPDNLHVEAITKMLNGDVIDKIMACIQEHATNGSLMHRCLRLLAAITDDTLQVEKSNRSNAKLAAGQVVANYTVLAEVCSLHVPDNSINQVATRLVRNIRNNHDDFSTFRQPFLQMVDAMKSVNSSADLFATLPFIKGFCFFALHSENVPVLLLPTSTMPQFADFDTHVESSAFFYFVDLLGMFCNSRPTTTSQDDEQQYQHSIGTVLHAVQLTLDSFVEHSVATPGLISNVVRQLVSFLVEIASHCPSLVAPITRCLYTLAQFRSTHGIITEAGGSEVLIEILQTSADSDLATLAVQGLLQLTQSSGSRDLVAKAGGAHHCIQYIRRHIDSEDVRASAFLPMVQVIHTLSSVNDGLKLQSATHLSVLTKLKESRGSDAALAQACTNLIADLYSVDGICRDLDLLKTVSSNKHSDRSDVIAASEAASRLCIAAGDANLVPAMIETDSKTTLLTATIELLESSELATNGNTQHLHNNCLEALATVAHLQPLTPEEIQRALPVLAKMDEHWEFVQPALIEFWSIIAKDATTTTLQLKLLAHAGSLLSALQAKSPALKQASLKAMNVFFQFDQSILSSWMLDNPTTETISGCLLQLMMPNKYPDYGNCGSAMTLLQTMCGCGYSFTDQEKELEMSLLELLKSGDIMSDPGLITIALDLLSHFASIGEQHVHTIGQNVVWKDASAMDRWGEMALSSVRSEQDCVHSLIELARVLLKNETLVQNNFGEEAENLRKLVALETKLSERAAVANNAVVTALNQAKNWVLKIDSMDKSYRTQPVDDGAGMALEIEEIEEIDVALAGELEAVAADISAGFSSATAAVGSAATLGAARTMVRAIRISAEQANSTRSSVSDRAQWEGALDVSFTALRSMIEDSSTWEPELQTAGAIKKVADLVEFYESLKGNDAADAAESGSTETPAVRNSEFLSMVKQTLGALEKLVDNDDSVTAALNQAKNWVLKIDSMDKSYRTQPVDDGAGMALEIEEIEEIDVALAGELEAVAADISAGFSSATAAVGSAATLGAARTMVRAIRISAEQANSTRSSVSDRAQWEGALDVSFTALRSMIEDSSTWEPELQTAGAIKKVADLVEFYESLKGNDAADAAESGSTETPAVRNSKFLSMVKQTLGALEEQMGFENDLLDLEEVHTIHEGIGSFEEYSLNPQTDVIRSSLEARVVSRQELDVMIQRVVEDPKTALVKIKSLTTLASSSKTNRLNIALHEDMISAVREMATHKSDPFVAKQALELFSFLSTDGLREVSAETQAAIIDFIMPLLSSILTEKARIIQYLQILIELAQTELDNIRIMVGLDLFSRLNDIIRLYPENTAILPLLFTLLLHVMFDNDDRTCSVCKHFLPHVLSSLQLPHHKTYKMAVRALGSLSVVSSNVPAMLRLHVVEMVSGSIRQFIEDPETAQIAAELFGNLGFSQIDELPTDCQDIMLDEGAIEIMVQIIDVHPFNKNVLCACYDTLANFQDDFEACSKMMEEDVVPYILDSITTFDGDQHMCSPALYLLSIITELEWGAESLATIDNVDIILNCLRDFASSEESEIVEDLLRILMNVAAHEDEMDAEESGAFDSSVSQRTSDQAEEDDVINPLPAPNLNNVKIVSKTIRSRLSLLKAKVEERPAEKEVQKSKKSESQRASEKQGSVLVASFGLTRVRWTRRWNDLSRVSLTWYSDESKSNVKGQATFGYASRCMPQGDLMLDSSLASSLRAGKIAAGKASRTFWIMTGAENIAICADSAEDMEEWIQAIRHNIDLRARYHSEAKLTISELSQSLAELDPWTDNPQVQSSLDTCIKFIEGLCEPDETVLKAWRVKYCNDNKATWRKQKEGIVVLTTVAFYRFEVGKQAMPLKMKMSNIESIKETLQGGLAGIALSFNRAANSNIQSDFTFLPHAPEFKPSFVALIREEMLLAFEHVHTMSLELTKCKQPDHVIERDDRTSDHEENQSVIERTVISPVFSSSFVAIGGIERMVASMRASSSMQELRNYIKVFDFLALDDSLANEIARFAIYPMLEMPTQLSDGEATQSVDFTEPVSAALTIGSDPNTAAMMFMLFSQLAFGRDNVRTLVQCNVIPMLCQALAMFPGELPIIKASLKVLDHIAIESEEYAALVCESGGLDAISNIAEDYSWHTEISALCRDAANSIKMMRQRHEQNELLSRRQRKIKGKEENSKTSARLMKLNEMKEGLDWTQGPCSKQGYLLKSTRTRIKWTKRWFVLGENHLRWYASSEAAETDIAEDDKKKQLQEVQGLVASGIVKPEIFDELHSNSMEGGPSSLKGRVDLTWKTKIMPHHIFLQRKQEADESGSWDLAALVSSRLPSTFWIVTGNRHAAFCADSAEDMEEWIQAIRHNIDLRARYHSEAKLTISELSQSLAELDPWTDNPQVQSSLDTCIKFIEGLCEPDETVLKAWRVKAWGQSSVGQKLAIYKERVLVLTTTAFYRVKQDGGKVVLQSEIMIENVQNIEEASGKGQDKAILYGMRVDFVQGKDGHADRHVAAAGNDEHDEPEGEKDEPITWQQSQVLTSLEPSQALLGETEIEETLRSSHVYYVVAPENSNSFVGAADIRAEMVRAFEQVHAVDAADSRQLWKNDNIDDVDTSVGLGRVMDCDTVSSPPIREEENTTEPVAAAEVEDGWISHKNGKICTDDGFVSQTSQTATGFLPSANANEMFALMFQSHVPDKVLGGSTKACHGPSLDLQRQKRRTMKRQTLSESGRWSTEALHQKLPATVEESIDPPDGRVNEEPAGAGDNAKSKETVGIWNRIMGRRKNKKQETRDTTEGRDRASSQIDSLMFAKNRAGIRKLSRGDKARAFEL